MMLIVCAIFTLLCTTIYLSLDVLVLLIRSHGFLFITTISVLNWGCLAFYLGDRRMLVCVPSYYAAQIGILMDANFRTYPTVLRTIVVVTPAVVSIAVFCALEIVHHPKNLHIFVGGNAVSIANVLSYTSTTLAIFLTKKVVLKIRGAHATFPGSDIIACVVLRAKMELRPARSTRRLHKYVDVSSIASATPQIQPMVLSRRTLSKIDALNCFSPQCFSAKHDAPVTAWLLALWYLVGVIGFLLLSVQFVSLMVNSEALHTPLLQPLPSNVLCSIFKPTCYTRFAPILTMTSLRFKRSR